MSVTGSTAMAVAERGALRKSGEVAEQLSFLEHVQDPLFAGDQLADLDLPVVHEGRPRPWRRPPPGR